MKDLCRRMSEQGFLNFNVHTNHWGSLLKFRFRGSRGRLVTLHFFLKSPPSQRHLNNTKAVTLSRKVIDHSGGSGERILRHILEAQDIFVDERDKIPVRKTH